MGIATGPLVGGVLGGISWRGPFFGVSALMAIALVCIVTLLPESPEPTHHTSIAAPFQALRHRGLLIVSLTALLYNFGFFTLLAYTPFPLDMGTYAIGFIFCGWGVLLALASVFRAPRLQRRWSTRPCRRPTASSASRAAPYLAGKLGEHSIALPFWVGAACTAAAVVVLRPVARPSRTSMTTTRRPTASRKRRPSRSATIRRAPEAATSVAASVVFGPGASRRQEYGQEV